MIGIVGQGFVGNAVYQKFKNYFDVHAFDLDTSKANASYEKVVKNKIIFIYLIRNILKKLTIIQFQLKVIFQ